MKNKFILNFINLSIILSLVSCDSYQPLENPRLSNNIFPDKELVFNLICEHDFIGMSRHGDIFDFYEYTVETDISRNIDSFPNFFPGMFDKRLKDFKIFEIQKWTKTPVIKPIDDESALIILEYGNLFEYSCSLHFLKEDYLNKEGNYYSYLSAYPMGTWVFVFVPDESKLFLIRSKG